MDVTIIGVAVTVTRGDGF